MKTAYTELGRKEAGGIGTAYLLTESEIEVEGVTYIRYGVRVERDNGESAEVRDVFGDKRSAGELVRRLCRCTVTPTSLIDVVSDAVYAREFGL